MSYGVLPTGFARKSLAEILAEIEAANIATFGPGVIQSAESPLGQLNGLFANLIAQEWEIAEDTYQSYDPDQAEGIRLEMLGRIRLLGRALGESDDEFRRAITNAGQARIDLQDLARAIKGLPGVTWVSVFVNDRDEENESGLSPHTVAVAVIGGDDEAIATEIRNYVVPGIGTYGNRMVDTTIDGYCRSIAFVRPVPVSVSLTITVRAQADRYGCPPPSAASIAAGLWSDLNGDRRLRNGDDVTVFSVRSIVESRFPNVEVLSVVGTRDIENVPEGDLPVVIAFEEMASFDLGNVKVELV